MRSGHLLVASAVAVAVGAAAVLGSLPREDLTLVWVAIGAVGVALVSLTAGVLVHRAGAAGTPGATTAGTADASSGDEPRSGGPGGEEPAPDERPGGEPHGDEGSGGQTPAG